MGMHMAGGSKLNRSSHHPYQVLRAVLLLGLLCTTYGHQLGEPPISELHALTDFYNANGDMPSNIANVGNWNVSFSAQGNWTGGHPCHDSFQGLQCWNTGNVRMLRLPNSSLSGPLSPALGNLKLMARLSLGYNNLSGDIAAALRQLVDLKRLRLQGNNFTGSVSDLARNMVKLEELTLGSNWLSGLLPPGVFTNLNLLHTVDFSNNKMLGTIPDDLLQIPSLRTLLLNGNSFSGKLPSVSSLSLNKIDLSDNSLSGFLPSVWNTPNLTILNLSGNNFSGPIPSFFLNASSLSNLTLAGNQFVGNVSRALSVRFGCDAFVNNPGLVMEDLGCVTVPVLVPSELPKPSTPSNGGGGVSGIDGDGRGKRLRSKTIVLLTAGDIAVLVVAVVLFTLFWIWWKKKKEAEQRGSGSISPSSDSSHNTSSHKLDRALSPHGTSTGMMTSGGSGKVSSSVSTSALRPALKSVVGVVPDPVKDVRLIKAGLSPDMSLSTDDLVVLDSTLLLEYEDLLKANALELGSGSFGSAYMAVLESDGHELAIKKLDEQVLTSNHAFRKQCTHLADVMHPNVLRMRAYCWSPNEKLLIFDYMPNGSLHSFLHGVSSNEEGDPKKGIPLDWSSRLKIAVGTARALAHLHDSDMVHGNMKASNVLFDEQFEPRVSDFGLHTLLQQPSTHIHSAGYLAPEIKISTGLCSQEADVYALGVVLLELLTGLEPMGKNNIDLPTWVQEMASSNRTVEVFDPALVSMHVLPAQVVLEFLELAQACVSEDARARPSITIVLRRLESIVPGSNGPRPYVADDEGEESYGNIANPYAFSSGFRSRTFMLKTPSPESLGEEPTGMDSPTSPRGSFYSDYSSPSSFSPYMAKAKSST